VYESRKRDRRCFHPMEYHARHASLHSFTLNPHARATQGPAGARLMMHRAILAGVMPPVHRVTVARRLPQRCGRTRRGHAHHHSLATVTLPLCHFATLPRHPFNTCCVTLSLFATSASHYVAHHRPLYATRPYRYQYSPSLTRPEHFVPRHPVIVCHVISLSLRATSSSPVHCVPCQRLPPLPPPPLLAPGVPPGWSEGSHENGLLRSSSGSMSSSVNPPPSASSGHPPSSSYSTFADQGLGVGIQGFNLFRVEV